MTAKTASEKVAVYDGRYPDSLPPDRADQKIERYDRAEFKHRASGAAGGSGKRFFGVPALPWHEDKS